MPGPSADVRLNVSANSAQAQFARFSAQFKRMMKDMERGVDGVNKKPKKKGFESWSHGIVKSTGNLLVMGTVVTGIYSTAQLISDEFDNAVKQSDIVLRRQETYQQALKKFSFTAIPATVEDRPGFIKMVDTRLSGLNLEDKKMGLEIIKTFMSTMGDALPKVRVESAVEFIDNNRHLVNQNDGEEARITGGVVAMAQLNYAKMGSTIAAQIGLLNNANNIAATADPSNFATNIAPAGNKLNILGANQIEALALAAAMSNALNDSTGQLVETATTNIAAKMAIAENRFGVDTTGKSFLERQAFIRSDDDVAKQMRKYLLGSFRTEAEKLSPQERSMMSDAEINKSINPKLGGRAKTLFAAMQFFQQAGSADGEGSLNKLFRSAIAEMGGVLKAPNQIDVQETYRRAEALQRQRINEAETSPMFNVANRQLDYREAGESIAQSKSEASTLYSQLTNPESEFRKMLLQAGATSSRLKLAGAQASVSPSNLDSLLSQQKSIVSEVMHNQLSFFDLSIRSHLRDWSPDIAQNKLENAGYDEGQTELIMQLKNLYDSIQNRIDSDEQIRTRMQSEGYDESAINNVVHLRNERSSITDAIQQLQNPQLTTPPPSLVIPSEDLQRQFQRMAPTPEPHTPAPQPTSIETAYDATGEQTPQYTPAPPESTATQPPLEPSKTDEILAAIELQLNLIRQQGENPKPVKIALDDKRPRRPFSEGRNA